MTWDKDLFIYFYFSCEILALLDLADAPSFRRGEGGATFEITVSVLDTSDR